MEALKEFMRLVPQCVTVVATYFEGEPHGMTVSSFTSLSLNPPLVMAALQRDTKTCKAVLGSGRFSVNLLSEKQARLSDVFAYEEHSKRFTMVKHWLKDGVYPVIDGVIAVLFCEVYSVTDVGDHKLVVGEVKGYEVFSDEPPLIYLMRRYYGVKPF